MHWDDGNWPEDRPITWAGWLRVAGRGVPLFVLHLVCFPALLILRVPEKWIWGYRRPITPWITQFVCISACWIMGLKRNVSGVPSPARGAYVANHSSWLDIFVLNASKRDFATCPGCPMGQPCTVGTDCDSGACDAGSCVAPGSERVFHSCPSNKSWASEAIST